MVHEIIALTFIGRRPKKHDVAHKDGNGSNNRLKNLTYKTRGKNNEDIVYHGRRLLSVSQVRKIKRASSYKETCVLADRFGVSRGHAYNIMRGRGYAHIVA